MNTSLKQKFWIVKGGSLIYNPFAFIVETFKDSKRVDELHSKMYNTIERRTNPRRRRKPNKAVETIKHMFIAILILVAIFACIIYLSSYSESMSWASPHIWNDPQKTIPTPVPAAKEPEPIPVVKIKSNPSSKIELPSEDDYDKVVTVINKRFKGKLSDKGLILYRLCKSQNPPVSAMMTASIILQEVGLNCDSPLLINHNNVGGLNWYKGCKYPKTGRYIDFPTVEASMKELVRNLSQYYIAQGFTDITKIASKYAPTNDYQNGMFGMNNDEWPVKVTKSYNQMTKEVTE